MPNEINRVEALLKKQGFHVVKVMNPTGENLNKAFKDFISNYGYDPDNRLLFFFSGHGHTRKDGQKGYLVPADAPNPKRDEKGFLRKALPMGMILAWSRQVEAKHALFLFDSCFSGTVFKAKYLPESPQYITAGDAGESVPAKSVFTPAFLDALEYGWGDLNKDGYVCGTALGLYLQQKVPQHSEQNPQYGKIKDYDLARGDFVFQLASSGAPVPKPASSKGRLFVETSPESAQVRIMNIGPAYKPGIALKAGSYDVAVSAAGYESWRQWVDLDAGKEKRIRATLSPVPLEPQTLSHAAPRTGEIWKEPVTGMAFVWVPKGCFQMGQTAAEKQYLIKEAGEEKYKKYYARELPRHKVCVDGFWMGKWEVTRGQFRAFVKDSGYRTDAEKKGKAFVFNKETEWKWKEQPGYSWKKVGYSQDDSHPAACISWNDAVAFGKWLSRKSGKKIHLPTEAQWEYAARGGVESMRFWGSDESDACRYANIADKGSNWSSSFPCSDGYKFTAPVGHYRPNPFGLYDMLGNVWEWCADRFGKGYYSRSPEKNPPGPSSGSFRVLRGGSWNSLPRLVRCAYRLRFTPGNRITLNGFRLVAVPPQ